LLIALYVSLRVVQLIPPVFRQCPQPLRPKCGAAGGPATQPGLGSARRQPHGSGSHGGSDGEGGEEEHSKLWLEDDGASGVGAAAAAAVSVALARSWHASAHEVCCYPASHGIYHLYDSIQI